MLGNKYTSLNTVSRQINCSIKLLISFCRSKVSWFGTGTIMSMYWDKQISVIIFISKKLHLTGARRGHSFSPCAIGSQNELSTYEKNYKLKRKLFNCYQMKEIRRKVINASQLTIRNFNGNICNKIITNPLQIGRHRTQLWGITILTKDNLKNNSGKKVFN